MQSIFTLSFCLATIIIFMASTVDICLLPGRQGEDEASTCITSLTVCLCLLPLRGSICPVHPSIHSTTHPSIFSRQSSGRWRWLRAAAAASQVRRSHSQSHNELPPPWGTDESPHIPLPCPTDLWTDGRHRHDCSKWKKMDSVSSWAHATLFYHRLSSLATTAAVESN